MTQRPADKKKKVDGHDILAVHKQFSELRDLKKDLAEYTNEDSYFSRAFYRCFELGPFVLLDSAKDSDRFSSVETGPVMTSRTNGGCVIRMKRYILNEEGAVEPGDKVKPGESVIWRMYFRNTNYPSTPGKSNLSIPEIISMWDKFSPLVAEVLETELENVDTVVKAVAKLTDDLAPDMLSDYAPGKPGI